MPKTLTLNDPREVVILRNWVKTAITMSKDTIEDYKGVTGQEQAVEEIRAEIRVLTGFLEQLGE